MNGVQDTANVRRTPRAFLIAVDGSESSHDAFIQCVDELMGRRDVIDIQTITDVTKDYLATHLRPEEIIDQYQTECIGRFPRSRYQLYVRERSSGAAVEKEILTACLKFETNYIVLGSYGRKGKQDDPHRVGKTAIKLAKESARPLIIVKRLLQRKNTVSGGFCFILCIDGSSVSKKIIQVAKDLARHPKDTVFMVHVDGEDAVQSDTQEKEMIGNWEGREGVKMFMIKQDAVDGVKVPIGDTLSKWTNENELEFDFLLLGAGGHGCDASANYFEGKVMDKMINGAKLNVVVVPWK